MGTISGPNNIADGLVFHIDATNTRSYPGSGTLIYDLVTGGIAGTLTNGPFFDVANKGGILFDGTNDYALFGRRADLQGTNITLSTWVKTYNLNSSDGAPYFGWTDGTNWPYGLVITSYSGLLIGYATSSARMTINNASLNKWYHLAVTSIGNSNNFYVNGIGVSSITASLGFAATNLLVSGWGGAGYASYGKFILGSAKIHNRALTSNEINQEYNSTKKKYYPEENIVTNGLTLNVDAGNYSSYSGSGTSWIDISGNDNHLSLSNGPIFVGTFGGAFIFDGSNDNANRSFVLSGNFSFEIIFKFFTGSGAYPRLIGTGDIFELSVQQNGTIHYYGKTSPSWAATGISIDTNQYVHLCGVKSGSNFYLYRNSILGYTGALSFDPTSTLYLASRHNGSELLNCAIANFRIYNRALTASEVGQNFNAMRNRYGI
jgi:hypothetical protein